MRVNVYITMIYFLLILGITKTCQASGWGLGYGYGEGHSFGEISLDHNSISHDLHGWNQIHDLSDNKKPISGLEAWLQDVVIGKDHKGLVKPIIKEIAYPVYKNVEIKIPYPQVQQVNQPYPVLVPMLHPVPYEVIKTVVKTVEKKVPTPVEKIVPVPVEKPVPYEVVKHIPMFVEKKIPIKIPVYKTIHHKVYN
ncbi:uncharacterized protein LOC100679224 [Nasonia vitripennis]|uniref:Uncharacterized protein n=1 Tax=Nasonia vitripennis TaxID=7425 RepID=A0A7M7LNR7_NASVI|nr:uncharacterized protein LOC100679224 [Nasonia vitripennis]